MRIAVLLSILFYSFVFASDSFPMRRASPCDGHPAKHAIDVK